jgi:DNA methylase
VKTLSIKRAPPSTVGRGKQARVEQLYSSNLFTNGLAHLHCGDSLEYYSTWETPSVIVSDGGYGVLGFEGDTSDHLDLPRWYEPHIAAWSAAVTTTATLWFWNSEIGWAAVHPLLEKHGWRYVSCNVWNKTKAHIAGNVNTARIRQFPVVTEVCVHYVKEPRISGQTLQSWLIQEWKRTGLPRRKANEACGVRDAAVRKYFDKGHLWYFPPAERFQQLADYANEFGAAAGRPYFSRDGERPLTGAEWAQLRTRFHCPHGVTNVWERFPLKGKERVKATQVSERVAHLNQKPLDLLEMTIRASSAAGEVVWEPFGGLFSASLAATRLGRKAYAAELDPTYFTLGVARFMDERPAAVAATGG